MRLAFPLPLIPQRPPSALAAVPKPVDFGADAAKSTDLAIDGWGDAQGYHLDVGREKSGFAWQEAALISPEGVDDSSWIGYQCLSGDGRFAAVAVLPASVVNRQAARDHGALAYSVDLASGLVRPLATGVGLKYFSPGCGTGDEAVFSLDTGVNDQNTQLLSANLATGKIDAAITTSGQVTSAVPTASRIVGAAGPRLVSVSGNGKSVVVATESGDVYDLRPAADGGVNFLLAGRTLTIGDARAELVSLEVWSTQLVLNLAHVDVEPRRVRERFGAHWRGWDDAGTQYQGGRSSGGGSHSLYTERRVFEPGPPEEARVATLVLESGDDRATVPIELPAE